MDPAVYNAIKAEAAKLEAEKNGLKMQKEVLEFNDAFFSPKVFDSREVEITPYTYAIHHYQNSWFSPKAKAYYRFRALLVKVFGLNFVRKAELWLMPGKFKK